MIFELDRLAASLTFDRAAQIADLFGARADRGYNVAEEVYPGYPGIVVREHEGARVVQSMTWGLPVRLKGMKPTSKPKPVNNARDDKLLSPFWKYWFSTPTHRCLIPFTAFAEAEGPKGKMTRTWISVEDQPTAAWAGLWRPSDEWGNCYTGVMVDATEELFDIHDRMPVNLHPDEHDAWLDCPAKMQSHWCANIRRAGLSSIALTNAGSSPGRNNQRGRRFSEPCGRSAPFRGTLAFW